MSSDNTQTAPQIAIDAARDLTALQVAFESTAVVNAYARFASALSDTLLDGTGEQHLLMLRRFAIELALHAEAFSSRLVSPDDLPDVF